MVPEILSAAVALVCVLASARRLAWAIAPMDLDARLVADALEKDASRPGGAAPGLLARLQHVLARDARDAGDGRFALELRVLEALSVVDDEEREARLGEEMTEVEGRSERWARVPRVGASVASSAGFLFAALALIHAFGLPAGDDMLDPTGPVHVAIASALGALALGMAAAAFCASVHMRARRARRERMSAVSRLFDLARHASASDGIDEGEAG